LFLFTAGHMPAPLKPTLRTMKQFLSEKQNLSIKIQRCLEKPLDQIA